PRRSAPQVQTCCPPVVPGGFTAPASLSTARHVAGGPSVSAPAAGPVPDPSQLLRRRSQSYVPRVTLFPAAVSLYRQLIDRGRRSNMAAPSVTRQRADAAWIVVVLAGVTAAMHIWKLPTAIPVIQHELGMSLVQAGVLLGVVQVAGMAG